MRIMGFLCCMWFMVQLHYLGVKFWGLKHVHNAGTMGWIVGNVGMKGWVVEWVYACVNMGGFMLFSLRRARLAKAKIVET